MVQSFRAPLRALTVYLLYFAGAWLSLRIRAHGGFASLIWIPGGIGFTCLTLFGMRYWPSIFLAAVSYFLLRGMGWVTSLYLGLGGTFDALVGTGCLLALGVARPTLVRLREIFCLLGAVLAGSLVGSGWVLMSQLWRGAIKAENLLSTGRSWLLSDVLSEVVIGGFFLNVWNDRKHWRALFARRRKEAVGLGLASFACGTFIFTDLARYNHSLLVRPYILFALMLWAGLRFDVAGAAFLNLTAAILIVIGGLQKYNAAPSYTGIEALLLLQYLVLTLAVLGLVLGAEEREKRDAIEARNEFLGIASHELKTPITSMRLQIQLFQKRLREGAAVDGPQFLERLDRQTGRLTRIVNLLLDISRVDRGDRTLDRQRAQLRGVVEGVVERLAVDLAKGRCVAANCVPPGLEGDWDVYRIEQVLENLVSNAIKYAPGCTIRIEGRREGSFVEVSVSDNGPGIPLDRQSLLFERFYRALEPSGVQGLGLGLYLSRQIVEAHGGKIMVESREGRGTAVRIRLPAATSEPETKAV